MNRQDLIKAVARETGFMKKDVTAIFEAMDELVVKALRTEGKVKPITGVTIEAKIVPEHEARNPQTGETITVAQKKKVSAKIGAGLKAAVNK